MPIVQCLCGDRRRMRVCPRQGRVCSAKVGKMFILRSWCVCVCAFVPDTRNTVTATIIWKTGAQGL